MASSSPGTGRDKSIIIIGIIIIVTTLIVRVCATPNQIHQVSELCRDTKQHHHNRVIEGASITSVGERNLNCIVTFQTDTILQRFMLRFERLQLDCNDHLYIYDGAYAMGPYKADLSCRNTLSNVGTIYSQTNHVTFHYVTDQWGPASNGYRLIITAFKDKKHTCMQFRCQTTNFCIDRDLTCDGVNHCGDFSDESTSLARCPSDPFGGLFGDTGLLLVTGVAASMILCCAMSVCVAVCIYRRNRATRTPPDGQSFPMDATDGYRGSNGTYNTVIFEKPPPYPGATHYNNAYRNTAWKWKQTHLETNFRHIWVSRAQGCVNDDVIKNINSNIIKNGKQ